MKFEPVIGLEIHVQLKTASKMFCRCSNESTEAKPNQHTCPVCLGLPGTLPVPNRTAVEWAVKTALALGCTLPEISKFDRKQYFYPDLPKGYQISQYDEPLGQHGKVEFDLTGPGDEVEAREVRITRLHLEEDAGKLTHPKGAAYSLVDLNRAGTPLMEIVTEPDLRSPAEARVFLQELRLMMRHLGVSDADMEKGHLRADANISLRPVGSQTLGTKTELKNLNSFKFVEKGLADEITRQTKLLASGKAVAQETRGFIEATGKTVSQRSKEEAQDYRYFPEPDIPPIELSQLQPDKLRDSLPELPVVRKRRWREYGVSSDAITAIGQDQAEAAAFDGTPVTERPAIGKLWLNLRTSQDFQALTEPADWPRFAAVIQDLERAIAAGQITVAQIGQAASGLVTGQTVDDLVASGELKSVDAGAVSELVEKAIADNPKAVADFKKGNPAALNVIVGLVMKASRGSANPTTVKTLVAEKLEHL